MTVSIPFPGGLGDAQAVLEEARVRARRRRRRIGGAAIATLAVGGALYATTSSGGNPPASNPSNAPVGSGHLVAAPFARLVDPQVVLPPLPSGLALVADSHINSTAAPYSYGETIDYSSGTATKGTNVPAAQLVVSFSEEDRPFSYQPASCSPASICPASHLVIHDKLATVMSLGSFRGNVGRTVVWWHPMPNISITVSGHGLTRSVVERITTKLSLAAVSSSCVVNGVARHTGMCAPGLIDISPPATLSPSQATRMAAGSISSRPWVLYGAISADDRRTWIEISYDGALATFLQDAPVTSSEMTGARNGKSFLIGMLPKTTTRVEVPNGKQTIDVAPSQTSLRGWRFFALPMPSALAQSCKLSNRVEKAGQSSPPSLSQSIKSTTIKFYEGTQLLGTTSACNSGVQFSKTK